jgi:leader peptidase (prepilin peptidase) / N-methyltransferase
MYAVSLFIAVVLLTLSSVDVREHRLPDALTLPFALTGFVACAVYDSDELPSRMAAAALGYLLFLSLARVYESARNRQGLGLGDAKLFAAAGAWLGFEGLPTVLLFATVTALAAVALLALCGRPITSHGRVAFGPFLSLGIWVTWLYGPLG